MKLNFCPNDDFDDNYNLLIFVNKTKTKTNIKQPTKKHWSTFVQTTPLVISFCGEKKHIRINMKLQ